MGVRTNLNGIQSGYLGEFFRKRTLDNPYTPYSRLSKNLDQETAKVKENLLRKVDDGFIGLDELLSGGRATQLFKAAGLFPEALEKLSRRKAVILLREEKPEQFIFSGKKAVPYVVEHLPADEVANILHQASKPISTRSVVDLKEIGRYARAADFSSIALAIKYELVYDDRPITTEYFPYNLEDIFCFKRPQNGVRTINRGMVIADNLVMNMSQILDALDGFRTSPLDSILISLMLIQGHGSHRVPILRLPELELEEIKARDHFTKKARAIRHRAVCEEFERMKREGGDEKSFKVFIDRSPDLDGRPIYRVQIAWEKRSINPPK